MYKVYLDQINDLLVQVDIVNHTRSMWTNTKYGINDLEQVNDMSFLEYDIPPRCIVICESTNPITKNTHPELFI